jgi:hypothetical protein
LSPKEAATGIFTNEYHFISRQLPGYGFAGLKKHLLNDDRDDQQSKGYDSISFIAFCAR